MKSIRNNNSRIGISHPEPFQPSFVLKKRLRFKAVAAATTTLTFNDLFDLWCMAATTTSAYRLAQAFRVKKIEVWGPMASDLVPVTVSCDWTGSTTSGSFGKSNRVSDTSMGSTEPAHLSSRPPAGSQIAQWITGGSTTPFCILTYPLGSVVDLTYEIVCRDDGTAQSVASAVAGATVGANYVRALDSTSGVNLIPISYSTI